MQIAGTDFAVTTVNDFPSIPGAEHLEATATLNLTGLTAGQWVVVLVRGTDGVSRPLFPVVAEQPATSTGNTTLAKLTDGNLGENGVMALAFTNPLYVDVDGGGVDAAGRHPDSVRRFCGGPWRRAPWRRSPSRRPARGRTARATSKAAARAAARARHPARPRAVTGRA